MNNLKKKDFLELLSLTKLELLKILEKAYELKTKTKVADYKPFANKSMAMIFEKPSTRTRVSFEVGFYQLGGHPIFLSANDIQIGRGETIEDTARTLSEYIDLIMIRTFEHSKLEKLAEYATVPVINGLTDLYHPAQVLSDIFTIMESKGFDFTRDNTDKFKKLNLLYLGDGMNMAHSLISAAAIFGINLFLATPEGYEADQAILADGQRIAASLGASINIVPLADLKKTVELADIIYTDVWISMGLEEESAERINDFRDYQLNTELLKNAKKDVLVMHCLPAHRGEEITDEVMESENSIVFKQAGNRLHVQKAIMLYCLGEL